MSWLPGWTIFGTHTPIFWLNAVLGGVLGYIAARIRSMGTRYEGVRWMLVLGATAGVVGGATVFLFLSLLTVLLYFLTGGMRTGQLVLLSVLAQLALFVFFVYRKQ